LKVKNLIFYTGHNNLIGGDAKYFFILLKLFLNTKNTKIQVFTDINPLFSVRSDQWFGYNFNYKYLNTFPKVKLLNNNSFFYKFFKNIDFTINKKKISSYINFLLSAIFLKNFIYNFINFFVFFINLPKFSKHDDPILHVNNGSYPGKIAVIMAIYVAHLKGYKKIIMTVHNESIPKKFFKPYDYLYDLIIVNYCTHIIAVSNNVKKTLVNYRKFNHNKISVINVPLFDNDKSKLTDKAINLKNKYKNNQILLISGNYEEKRKGHDNLIKAMNIVTKKLPNTILLIVGNGSLYRKNYLSKLVDLYNINKNISFLGYQDSLEIYNLISDIVIVPSIDSEAIPYTVVEALRASKPIITSFYGGSKESVINNHNGFVVDPHNIIELANSIIKLLNDEKLLKSMSKNSRKIFEEKHRSERVFNSHLDIYN
jgi:glycosyltransferase involved in cell wall biosynthesis